MPRAPLPTRRLGTTGMTSPPSASARGPWAAATGPTAGARRTTTSRSPPIRRAVARGINWIDTAAVYGLGHSEEVVGRALESVPAAERPYVFTKCGLVWNEQDRMAAPGRTCARTRSGGSARPRSAASASSASISTSSTGPTRPARAVEDSWAEMARLIEEGKVRAAGVSNFDVDLLERCEAVRHVDSLQPPFSLIRRQAADGGDPPGARSTRPASSCTARCSPAS